MAGTNRPALTADQEKKAREIEVKYQKQLNDKEGALRGKAAELETALADGSTTVGKVNTLRSELYALEQDYWRLRSQLNQEVGTGYSGPMGWGCSWHVRRLWNHDGSGHHDDGQQWRMVPLVGGVRASGLADARP